jgi:molybdopterin converting factor small subunit
MTRVKILIPTPLRPFVGHQSSVMVDGATVSEAVADLVRRHDGIRKHLLDADGQIRSFVNVYVNDEDIRHLEGASTRLSERDVIAIVPSVAGGR